MNINQLAKKSLEWFSIGAVGFYLGVSHTAQLAYDGVGIPPEWHQQVAGYTWPIVLTVLLAAILWIGLDYFEYRITTER